MKKAIIKFNGKMVVRHDDNITEQQLKRHFEKMGIDFYNHDAIIDIRIEDYDCDYVIELQSA